MRFAKFIFIGLMVLFIVLLTGIGSGESDNSKLNIPTPIYQQEQETMPEPLEDSGIFIATAYTWGDGNGDGLTASMVPPDIGAIAVDPKVIPLGSKLWVEGYGYGIALDTGGAIKGKRIDVFFHDRQKALNWGVKKVKVRILK